MLRWTAWSWLSDVSVRRLSQLRLDPTRREATSAVADATSWRGVAGAKLRRGRRRRSSDADPWMSHPEHESRLRPIILRAGARARECPTAMETLKFIVDNLPAIGQRTVEHVSIV